MVTCLRNAVFGTKIRFLEKNEIYVKNMLTGNGKNAILSELLGTNCFQKNDNNILFQKKQKSC